MKIRIPIAYDENGVYLAYASSWTDEAAAEAHVRSVGETVHWVEVDVPIPEIPDGGVHPE